MKYNIALLTGGYSGESIVSYQSAQTVNKHLDKQKFNVYVIDIKPKEWVLMQEGEKYYIDKNDFSLFIKNEKIKFELCFIMIHGTPGEDGKLQGYFDMIGQAYLSCSAAVSQLTFNKFYTTAFLRSLGIKVAKSIILLKEKQNKYSKIIPTLNFPLFIKPNNGGSSIGISKIKKTDELLPAIEKAFKIDKEIIIEEQIIGREFTVGVFETKGNIQILPITEVQTQNDFFDFDAKYKGQSIEITPAKINASIKKKLENTAREIYQQLKCFGIIRIDMIYNEKEEMPYVLEINTIPGQTAMSFIPQQVKAFKLSLKKFYTLIILEAIKKSK